MSSRDEKAGNVSKLGQVWVFHDDRNNESYIWLIVKETGHLDIVNLETGSTARLESMVLDKIFHEDDGLWWERLA
jgi:hypothetical protein